MGIKSQFQIKMKQAVKRKKKRAKLVKNGRDLKEYYCGKYYLKGGKE